MRWVTFSAKLAAGAMLAGMLGACAGGSVAQHPDRVHTIQVERTSELIELPVVTEVDPRDMRRIDAFARTYLVNGRSPLTVAYPNNVDASEAVAAVVAALDESGVPMNRILRGPYSAEAEGERGIVVSYEGLAAFGSGCPQEWGDPTRDYTNQTPTRFGCARQHNLAAMIERPSDLVEPRAMTMADAERRQVVVGKYREGSRTNSAQAEDRTETSN